MINFKKITDWYFTKKSLPYWCILIFDCCIVFTSYMFIYQQLNSGAMALKIINQLTALFSIFTLFHAIAFKIFHTYDGILRYSSFVDLQRILCYCLWRNIMHHYTFTTHEIKLFCSYQYAIP